VAPKIIKIPSVFVYETKVAGVSKDNADGTSRQEIIRREVAEGDKLTLEAEPTNHYDANAIKVRSSNGSQIDYLNKEIASEIKPALDNETEIYVTAKWVSS